MRIIAVPFVFLVICAVASFQNWLNQTHSKILKYSVSLSLLAYLVNDMSIHTGYFDSLGKTDQSLAIQSLRLNFNSVTNHPDPVYFYVLLIGLGITIITGLFLILKAYFEFTPKSLLK